MIVEFLGNSGAGKSTLVPASIQFWRDKGLTAMSVTEAIHHHMRRTVLGRVVCWLAPRAWQGPILWRVFSHTTAKLHSAAFALRHVQLTRHVLASQLRRKIPRQHRRLILRLFFNMAGQRHFFESRSRPGEIIVFDEGFVHRAVHLFVSESERPDPKRVLAYLELVPRSDLVILVQAPLKVCLERIYERGLQVRLRGLKAEEVARFVEHAEEVINIASQYINKAGWQVIEVENNSDAATCAAGLCRNLEGYRPFIKQLI